MQAVCWGLPLLPGLTPGSALQTQNLQLSKEMTLASNRSLAEGNLLFQPRLDALKARLTQKYQELQALSEAYQIRKTRLGEGHTPAPLRKAGHRRGSWGCWTLPKQRCLGEDPAFGGPRGKWGEAPCARRENRAQAWAQGYSRIRGLWGAVSAFPAKVPAGAGEQHCGGGSSGAGADRIPAPSQTSSPAARPWKPC